MAGTSRIRQIALAWTVLLFLGGGVNAATVIAGPGTPETLIIDAQLAVYSSTSVRHRLPPQPIRHELMRKATVLLARTNCFAASTAAASAAASTSGYVWHIRRCLAVGARPETFEPLGIAYLYVPPPPAPYWPATTGPMQSPFPRGGLGLGARYLAAPVPIPLSGALLPAALAGLAAFRRRRR